MLNAGSQLTTSQSKYYGVMEYSVFTRARKRYTPERNSCVREWQPRRHVPAFTVVDTGEGLRNTQQGTHSGNFPRVMSHDRERGLSQCLAGTNTVQQK